MLRLCTRYASLSGRAIGSSFATDGQRVVWRFREPARHNVITKTTKNKAAKQLNDALLKFDDKAVVDKFSKVGAGERGT